MCKTAPIFLLLFADYLCNHTCAMTTVEPSSPPSSTIEESPSAFPVQKTPPSVHRVMVTSPHTSPSPQDPETGSQNNRTIRNTEQPPTTESPAGRDLSTQLVAGIGISMLSLLILVMIGVWCLRKKSKRNSAEITSDPSGGVGKNFNRREATQVVF